MNKCTQCGGYADLHIAWLAKQSEGENEPQECDVCNECMSLLWAKFHATQFGETIQIQPLDVGY